MTVSASIRATTVQLTRAHSSGVTRDTFTGRVDDIVANLGRLQRGEPLRNVVHAG